MVGPAALQIIGMFTNVMTMQKKDCIRKPISHTTHICMHKALHFFIVTRACIQAVAISKTTTLGEATPY
jgi:hypothetical protein